VETGEALGDTAMARTVSSRRPSPPVIFNGGITVRGVQIPNWREIYEPVLAELADRGVSMARAPHQDLPGPLDASPLG